MNKGWKLIGNVVVIICAIILIWFVASYFDTIMTNTTSEDVASWNAFEILF